VLAAIAGPMMQGNVSKAKKSEAVAGLGTIRTAERLYYVENATYTEVLASSWDNGRLTGYIRATDLNGRYFNSNCYSVSSGTSTMNIVCNTNARGVTESNLGNVYMNERGTIGGYN